MVQFYGKRSSTYVVPCGVVNPVSIPFPSQNETGAVAVQDGLVQQVITTVIATTVNIYPLAFDRILAPLANTIAIGPATPTPPGTFGSTMMPVNGFTGMQILTKGNYTITAGFATANAGVLNATQLTAQVVIFPNGVGTNTPTVIAALPLSYITIGGGSLIRGTVRVPNIPLQVDDIVQMQLVQTSALASGIVLTVAYAMLEVE